MILNKQSAGADKPFGCATTMMRNALLAGAAFVLPTGPAWSQTEQTDEGDQLDEIVVTAQHREERLQDVPISVHVIGEEQRLEQNLNSLNALAESVPSVHLSGVGGGGRANEIFIRGVGSGNNQSFDQSVGMFIDGVYHGRSRVSAGSFLDLERVEVLRGPQTTFFGNNAIAGAFSVITAQPGDSYEGWVRGLYGEDGQYVAEGAVNVPLSDTLSARFAYTNNGFDGWIHNVNTGENEPNEDNTAGRVSFRFEPNEAFDATLRLEASRKRNSGAWAAQVYNCPAPAPFTSAGFCATRLGAGLPTGLETYENSDSPGTLSNLDTRDAVLTLNYHVAGHTLTSVTGYYDYDFEAHFDGDFLPAQLLHINAPERYEQLSQEFRIASDQDGPIDYLVGVYYQTGDLNFSQDFTYGFVTPAINGTPALAGLIPYLPLGQSTNFWQDETSSAVFGSLTWHATDRLDVSVGLRGTRVEKDYDWLMFYGRGSQPYGGIQPLPAPVASLPATLGLGVPGRFSGSRTDDAWLPSLRVEYDLVEDVMSYVSYARGFKAGGFNGTNVSGNPAQLPFDPEFVDAYELGLKSEFFDRRLLLNLALFRSEYSDLQVSTNFVDSGGAIISNVRNAAESISQGLELESQWLVGDHWRFAASVTWLDSHYVSYPGVDRTALQTLAFNQCVALNPAPSTACEGIRFQDLSGAPTAYAPDWAGSLTATYTTPLMTGLDFTAEASARFSSSYYLTNTDDALLAQDDYTRLDARLSLESENGWAVDLIGKNLTSESIVTFAQSLPRSTGSTYGATQQPANVAIQARYSW